MTDLSQTAQNNQSISPWASDEAAFAAREHSLDEAQQCRVGAYGMLAQLLRNSPDQETLDQVAIFADLSSKADELALAMSMLGLSATTSSSETVDDEFHDLFIGMGRGELVPYGSWYQTGFLMERPLGRLRTDLNLLGFQRQDGVTEPEDHVAALCEVMAMLIQESQSVQVQSQFYETHLASWLARFFTDLSEAKSAIFYRAVGRFGKAFIALEKRYLNMTV
ncbi:MAG: molecular chaperone TorD family protein [Candidatus Thiodiazotropha sp. 6PLUC2]